MARSKHGKLIGRAAQEERRDLQERLYEDADKVNMAQLVKEIEDESDATRRCVALEGEVSFYKWFNDYEKVPPYGSSRERIGMIEARIKQLKLMAEHEASVANEEASQTESKQ